jgi:threo-3-hydroxy-L-aspartate ammonia-lyase
VTALTALTAAVDAAALRAATHALRGRVLRTPAVANAQLTRAAGRPVVCKAENLQHTGSFKVRGAYNHLLNLPQAVRARGVIGGSSGNHAAALAYAGRALSVPVTVVIPADAPATKREAILALGARVLTYDRAVGGRDQVVADIAEREGLAVVPSADSPHVVAGAATAAMELLAEHPDTRLLLAPVGGGGLAAGTALAAHHYSSRIRIIGVEPAAGADTQLSLRAGHRITLPAVPVTIADGLGHTAPAELPWAINRLLLSDVVTVTDTQITEAMVFAFRYLKLVLEPSGAVALGAVLAGHLPVGTGPVGVILSGGGVDLDVFHRLTTSPARRDPIRA